MATSAEKLKRFRLFRLTQINRLNEINSLAVAAVDHETWRVNFRMRLDDIEPIKTEFFKNHNSIIGLIDDSPEAFKTEDDIRKSFETTLCSIKSIQYKLFSPPPINLESTKSNIKLPKIELPSFSGDITTFISYLDMFNSIIHSNNELSKIEKFNYLIGSLKGDALAFIQHIPVSEDNYDLAYKQIVARYRNNRQILKAHWSALDTIKRIDSDKPHEIRNLIDTFSKNVEALKTFALPVDLADFLLFSLLHKKCDATLITRFELHHNSDNIPKYSDLKSFLEHQWNALENTPHKISSKPKRIEQVKSFSSATTSLVAAPVSTNNSHCRVCNNPHSVYKCPQFLSKTPHERYACSKSHQLCINCLSSGHSTQSCKSSSTCHKCKQRHHTLLHFEKEEKPTSPVETNTSSTSTLMSVGSASPTTSQCSAPGSTVLLATAKIEVINHKNSSEIFRALLDSGSQTSFITTKAANKLGLAKHPVNVTVKGLNLTSTIADQGAVTISLRPVNKTSPLIHVDCVVLSKICDQLPSCRIDTSQWSHRRTKLQLADPYFDVPSHIDLLLGADILPRILCANNISGNCGEPDAFETIFGYVLMGPAFLSTSSGFQSFFTVVDNFPPTENTLQKFWEIETVPQVQSVSPEDALCEKLYSETYSRDKTGRFIVALPFRDPSPTFPGSRELALQRFFSLENRLRRHPELYQTYKDFMKEYLSLNHMELVPPSTSAFSYYIPHHCVLKPNSLSTKLRVVFNASAHLPQQPSLNDHLLIGPKLQRDIMSILLSFRFHAVVFTVDVRMMYRQILLVQNQCDYQRIIWRFSPDDPVQDYRLLTVTYGISSAPFLAIRTLLQLAKEEASSFPLAASVLQTDTYVDDIVTGAPSVVEANQLKSELISLLDKGQFQLCKWASNAPDLLSDLPDSHVATNPLSFNEEPDCALKILGLQWNPSLDSFKFKVHSVDKSCTKRNLLSHLARIFDPLGILTPITFFLKHLIQRMWSLKLEWDESPPNDIVRVWENYQMDIPNIQELSLPRRLLPNNFLTCELHGFGDSSEKGYCAVIYFLFTSSSGEFSTFFVCSKAKVAPLKRISIPRLELCAAVLLTRLIDYVCKTYQNRLHFSRLCAWSDSTVVLSWIRSPSYRWKTFVSTRVTFIQETLPFCGWYHVPSGDNPADIGSRGVLPSQLLHCSLWWAGPAFLKSSSRILQDRSFMSESATVLEEERKVMSLTATVESNFLDDLLSKHSSFMTIVRIHCFIRRFINNSKSPAERLSGSLSSSELHASIIDFVRHVQTSYFSPEIQALQAGHRLPKCFQKLSPFLDDQNILRVGGRLKHAPLSFEKRFPAILPSSHRFTDLLTEYTHQKYFHAGNQLVQSLLCRQFWILSPKRAIRRILSKCIRCFRTRPVSSQPPMGDLPAVRLSQAKPFLHSGVDFAGPFFITLSRTRGAKTTKAYLCLFVCLATKALHLEIASDLSTDTFLAALRRFISRRGRCQHLYSDCGTNFVGAHRELRRLMKEAASTESIAWHFNPPSAPHFGGLFEAGVKSVKTHVLRVVGEQILTYEELLTLITQIEAMLNSRPLVPVSQDPNDLSALTPGHFLVLEPLTILPEPDLQQLSLNRLSRWQLVQRLFQSIWSRWSSEYLHTLHQRTKWLNSSTQIEPGTLVLIRNDLTPPLQWRLGRVTTVHPGTDGIVRVVTLKTAAGLVKRPVVKICPLPLNC